jgi:hypothetical protein
MKQRSEVLTAVTMENTVFWVLMPCSLVNVHKRFRGTCCPHLQGTRVVSKRWYVFTSLWDLILLVWVVNHEDGSSSSSATSVNIYQTIGVNFACLLALPEDGGSTFSETSVNFCQYMAPHPRRQHISTNCHVQFHSEWQILRPCFFKKKLNSRWKLHCKKCSLNLQLLTHWLWNKFLDNTVVWIRYFQSYDGMKSTILQHWVEVSMVLIDLERFKTRCAI